MGMGNYACHADTVEQDFVIKTCPDEWQNLLDTLAKNDSNLDQLAWASDQGDIQGVLEMDMEEEPALLILNAYDKLCTAFREKTDLELDVKYHEAEDRGDEVNGVFWEVNGVYILSPAGKKHKDNIIRKFWTVWG